jgi:uncharacterized protein (DUF1501 family)
MIPMKGSNRSAYEAARPNIKILTSQAFDAGDQDAGINDDLTGFAALHSLGRVAWFPGIGMPSPNLSHFEANDLWGQGRAQPNNTGWLGRFADTAFSANDVLRGITVTGDVPLMFRGADRSFVSISGGTGFVYPSRLRGGRLGDSFQPDLLEQQWATAVTSATAGGSSYDVARDTGALFFDAQNKFGNNGALPVRTPSVLYPGDNGYLPGGVSGGLSGRLKLIAQMIAANLGTEVFFARVGGWDTHSNQLRDHPQLMRQLGGAIKSFYDDLASIETPDGNAQARTMILAYSEFGRRIPENDGGTDHGTAGLSFAVGRSVQGGFFSDYPNLADPDGNKNMKYTVDFRRVYATVLDRWLGQPAAITDANLGTSYPRLNFL